MTCSSPHQVQEKGLPLKAQTYPHHVIQIGTFGKTLDAIELHAHQHDNSHLASLGETEDASSLPAVATTRQIKLRQPLQQRPIAKYNQCWIEEDQAIGTVPGPRSAFIRSK